MFQFTTRDLLGLTTVAGASCLMGLSLAPRDPVTELMFAGVVFVFGVSCYFAGVFVGKSR